jgi:hypothetical protein
MVFLNGQGAPKFSKKSSSQIAAHGDLTSNLNFWLKTNFGLVQKSQAFHKRATQTVYLHKTSGNSLLCAGMEE